MGNGYWILVWDNFGIGLNTINPRLFTDDEGHNCFLVSDNDEDVIEEEKQELIDRFGLEKEV